MRQKIHNRLRSRTGASLSFALLAFLVCAVVSSVVLVSATTAAGRMSGIAETDQRYYAVTSAAELLKDLFKDQTVVVERVQVEKAKNTCDDSGSVTYGTFHPQSDTTTVSLNGFPRGSIRTDFVKNEGEYEPDSPVITGQINASFVTDAALRTVETSLVADSTDPYYASAVSSANRTMTMQVSGKEALTVMVTETINPLSDGAMDVGTILFTVCNAVEDSDVPGMYEPAPASERYQLTLTFQASIDEVSENRSEDGSPYNIVMDDEGEITSYDFDTTATTKTTTTLTWRLISIR